MATPENRH